jgi:aspartyl-tRNA(Asn)/glutamyl-tRNA(Gln) amidotransferase subunit A
VAGSELLSLSISEARRRIRAREISPVELTQSYLQQIDRLNAPLNVYLTVTEEEALAAAKAAEDSVVRGNLLGSLHGIPVALKDNFEVAGVRTTAGSKFLRDNISGEDCEVAYRLRQAGAIILGKLHMHEWAIGGTTRNPHYGPGRNPWDPMRSPGGSSGGSGAAIAADMALAAMGTDTGGSVRIPAALNGVTALRPTSGRISKRGVVPVSDTFDTAGPLARRVEDVALVLQALGPAYWAAWRLFQDGAMARSVRSRDQGSSSFRGVARCSRGGRTAWGRRRHRTDERDDLGRGGRLPLDQTPAEIRGFRDGRARALAYRS